MDGLIGMIANVISTIVTHPIDVVKTNFQLAQTRNVKTNAINIFHDIFKRNGARGFLAGLTPNLLTYPVFWGIYFSSDQIIRGQDNRKLFANNFLDDFTKAYCSGILGSGLTNPIFVIKTRVQDVERFNANNKHNYKNPSIITVIRQTNSLGYQAYFRGLGSTYLNNLKLAIQFPLYKILKEETNSVTLSSFLAKVASSSISYPLDLIRINQRNSDTKLSIMEAGRKIIRNNGIWGMYRGVLLYNAVSIPNFMIMMVCVEAFKNINDTN